MSLPLEEQALLTTLLTQPHRYYHNINHINDCLSELEQFLRDDVKQSMYGYVICVEYAIWYHDVVYNPYSLINEEESARLFKTYHHSANKQLPSNAKQYISDAIIATASHTKRLKDLSTASKVLLDIDLAGLGKPVHIFAKNSYNLRKEYYNSTDLELVQGRLNFFKTLNKRETFYYTDYFHDKYHEQSKENVENEIYILEAALSQGYPEMYLNRVKEQALLV